jgi:hypothetical protein
LRFGSRNGYLAKYGWSLCDTSAHFACLTLAHIRGRICLNPILVGENAIPLIINDGVRDYNKDQLIKQLVLLNASACKLKNL